MTQNPTIKLPPERVDQLKAIGAVLGLSMVDVVGRLINAEIATGTIPDAMPGFTIKRVKAGVRVQLDDHTPKTYPVDQAKALAATIIDVIEGRSGGIYNVDHDWFVSGYGNGIKLETPKNPYAKIVARDIARDVARLIDAAADTKLL